jgi:serine/threonine protein kinase
MQSQAGNDDPSLGLAITRPSSPHLDDAHPSAPRLTTGELVPGTRFRIERRLSRGAVGEIYRATHVDLDRPVALKVLRDASNDDAVEGFRREAAFTTQIDSPYVVEVLDYGILPDGRPFYAMPWLGATALDAVIAKGLVPVAAVIGILRMACKGLAAAHALEITHRDVKPENLMLVEIHGKERLVVVDFGLATGSGSIPEVHGGTPTYMAPEQALGLPIDARADIYSLGCVAYEMLTGRAPFVAPTIVSLLRQHADCDPDPLSPQCAEPLPEGLETVILRCLEKSRDHRHASMLELEAALCEVQIESGIRTPWDPLPPPELDPPRSSAMARRLNAPRPTRARYRRAALLTAIVCFGGAAWLLPTDASVSSAELSPTVVEHLPSTLRHTAATSTPETLDEDEAPQALSASHAPNSVRAVTGITADR